jgi:integrase
VLLPKFEQISDQRAKNLHVTGKIDPTFGWHPSDGQLSPYDRGKLFCRVNKVGRARGDGMTVKAVWHIVKESARHLGVARLAPQDLRRTCARLCHASGGELEQIQFLLAYVSVQTTKRYLGCKQRIRSAVHDRIGIEPNP